jgi:hypothetical protein
MKAVKIAIQVDFCKRSIFLLPDAQFPREHLWGYLFQKFFMRFGVVT